MQHKTRGIVLHHIKYGDNSVIAYIYTEKSGRQAYLVKSVRGKKSKIKISIFSPLTILDMNVSCNHKRELQFLNEAHAAVPLQGIPADIVKSMMALLISEVLYKSLREETPNQELFEFLVENILTLDKTTGSLQGFHIYFLLKLTKYLGFYPSDNYSDHTNFFDLAEGVFVNRMPEHPYFLDREAALHFSGLIHSVKKNTVVSFPRQVRDELFSKLLQYYQVHLISLNEIKSYEVLKEVFN